MFGLRHFLVMKHARPHTIVECPRRMTLSPAPEDIKTIHPNGILLQGFIIFYWWPYARMRNNIREKKGKSPVSVLYYCSLYGCMQKYMARKVEDLFSTQ